ncbi:hypothetical protein L1887_14397 [Cichorium endivia]|nr:hypothetical protein L1887_14397 [Cichorium endivia]
MAAIAVAAGDESDDWLLAMVAASLIVGNGQKCFWCERCRLEVMTVGAAGAVCTIREKEMQGPFDACNEGKHHRYVGLHSFGVWVINVSCTITTTLGRKREGLSSGVAYFHTSKEIMLFNLEELRTIRNTLDILACGLLPATQWYQNTYGQKIFKGSLRSRTL